ncbi:MAG: adenylyltransferase/cytidyltransferase family protein [Candidatus Eremiobacteraeota bacterium]|nr:adenylyltransferase/cytidyltransferase family protein [Candidatus Eremiobacteraeota bacterium]MBC5827171.1 adenylyltransferase/cytidyltransferase family protein [Candidatus Eremiobacteraeota bacterium]
MAALDKIVERAELARWLLGLRAGGGKVVFTCGVFDVLHVGHVRYLEFARGLGAALIVGVNSDESVRQLQKGPERPIVTALERAEVVAALRAVDFVCVFDEPRPDATIAALKPDIHVKSAQYSTSDLPEAVVVERYGGVIVLAPHHPGHSTSDIIRRVASGDKT